MKPFDINAHGRLVFPTSFYAQPDFTSIDTTAELEASIRRDFEVKAPSGSQIAARVSAGHYHSRYELLRDLALHLFWVNRYTLTMYEQRPTRWRDVPRNRDDVFLSQVSPWRERGRVSVAVEHAFRSLPAAWSERGENGLFAMLFDIFRYRRYRADDLSSLVPTVKASLETPSSLVLRLGAYDPDYPTFSLQEMLDCHDAVPELEALGRWAMLLHNQHAWDRSAATLIPVDRLEGDDVVVTLHPRTPEVREFMRRLTGARPDPLPLPSPAPRGPLAPLSPVRVRATFDLQPRLEALAVRRGEIPCTNEDIVRNSASHWSPMSAEDISAKTGIETRCYTERSLEALALDASTAAVEKAGRGPEDIGAVLFCSCTTTRLIPSASAWLSGQLGMLQTHTSVDLVAACAGFPYGLLEATRVLQEVRRPVLLVCAEKFSDKVGSVRTSRMLFGDAAAALVIGTSCAARGGDLEVSQTYAGGPVSQVKSIVWPNPAFGNDMTVHGPEVRALVTRYLKQMISELAELPAPEGEGASLADAVELVVPHQANRNMVTELAAAAGLSPNSLYFNIDRVGNTSAASIPLAIHDAVADGVITRPTRVFAPGFGAGAVAGYAVLRIDPAIVAAEVQPWKEPVTASATPVREVAAA